MREIPKQEISKGEDYMSTVEIDEDEKKKLINLKKELYACDDGGFIARTNQLDDWYKYAKRSKPECGFSRLHQFLIGSKMEPGKCNIDDLEGDFSAKAFLLASPEERAKMIERLKKAG
jgi:hypothetical protein